MQQFDPKSFKPLLEMLNEFNPSKASEKQMLEEKRRRVSLFAGVSLWSVALARGRSSEGLCYVIAVIFSCTFDDFDKVKVGR
jgi:hypothetical protein